MAVDPDPDVVGAAGPDHGLGLAAAAGHAGPGLCQLCLLEAEDLNHAFFSCPKSMVAGLALLGYAQHAVHTSPLRKS